MNQKQIYEKMNHNHRKEIEELKQIITTAQESITGNEHRIKENEKIIQSLTDNFPID